MIEKLKQVKVNYSQEDPELIQNIEGATVPDMIDKINEIIDWANEVEKAARKAMEDDEF